MMKSTDRSRLEQLEKRIHELAQEYGLITTDILFELVSPRRMIEAMAYHFPTNFSHWSFGKDYEKARTIYDHSGSGIPYEVVWNFESPRAFLVETNPLALNALIIAHVYGHVDFFLRNNFLRVGREASDVAREARNAREKIQYYESKYGIEEVEQVIDAAMAIQWHQDPDPFAEDLDEKELRRRTLEFERAKLERTKDLGGEFGKRKTEEDIREAEKELRRIASRTPPVPMYDILRYITDRSQNLREWQREVLSFVRSQARHLAPNRRTKLLNEGWATYWHVKIMRRLFEEGLLSDEEHGTFNHFHSQVLRENHRSMNWYRVGVALYEHTEDRWDKGRFGPEYEECVDPYKKMNWDTGAMLGREKIFEVAASYSDRMAIESLFTDDFIHEQKLYIYEEIQHPQTGEIFVVVVENRPEVIRQLLKSQHTLFGMPQIVVTDGNYNNQGELYLKHQFTGFELDPRFEEGALEHIYSLWGKPVHLETVEILEKDEETGRATNLKPLLHSYDGKDHVIVEDD